MVEVVAALIWDGEKFLACQRPATKARALLWEFVGGKVEPGESKEQALIRECKEELDVNLRVQDEFVSVVHEYPDLTISLTVFNATLEGGTLTKKEHNDIKWITADEIDNFEFCPADKDVLAEIKRFVKVKKVYDFLKRTGTYYLATAEGNQPRVRPFGTIDYYKGKLYVQTGKIKNVSKQLSQNANAEICAFDGKEWLRVCCQLVQDERTEASEHMLDRYPSLKGMYKAGDGNTTVYYMQNAVATFSSFGGENKVVKF